MHHHPINFIRMYTHCQPVYYEENKRASIIAMHLSLEDVQDVIFAYMQELPQKIFDDLNGGVIVLPETKLHPESTHRDLYVLGEYHFEPCGLGRYISIYYGSFEHLCSNETQEEQCRRLKEVLYHELTHHLEHLAGDRSLELQDERDLVAYHTEETSI